MEKGICKQLPDPELRNEGWSQGKNILDEIAKKTTSQYLEEKNSSIQYNKSTNYRCKDWTEANLGTIGRCHKTKMK